tara:strand:+ start:8271 stop:8660 length:390 start_codon:yes stop_codon:yes gene_type:complete
MKKSQLIAIIRQEVEKIMGDKKSAPTTSAPQAPVSDFPGTFTVTTPRGVRQITFDQLKQIPKEKIHLLLGAAKGPKSLRNQVNIPKLVRALGGDIKTKMSGEEMNMIQDLGPTGYSKKTGMISVYGYQK